MDELQKIKIEMIVKNQYGDTFKIYQETDDDYCDLGEMEVYHNAYMNFLQSAGFCFNLGDRITVIGENEYIEEFCDGDCCTCEQDFK